MNDSDTMFLIPATGLQVRDPITAAPLSVEGEEKPKTAYWFRRLRDGDVQEAPRPSSSKESAPTPAPSKTKQAKE